MWCVALASFRLVDSFLSNFRHGPSTILCCTEYMSESEMTTLKDNLMTTCDEYQTIQANLWTVADTNLSESDELQKNLEGAKLKVITQIDEVIAYNPTQQPFDGRYSKSLIVHQPQAICTL